jgi:glycosyltransferase involved in cell wall biosynthesis
MRANDHVSRDHVKALEMYLENTGGKVDEKLNAFRRNVVEKYGDCVLAGGGGAVGLVEFEPFRPPVDPSELEYEISNATKPLIVHAPSDAQIKGTKFVIKSIEELRNEGLNFEFSLIQDRPAAEVREILSKSDIAVDQVIYPGHGLFAVEAMATGNAVLSGVIPGQFGFPENNPILSSTPVNLTENLRILIENKKLRRELQQRGLQYAKQEHDYITQCNLVKNKLNIDG